MSKKYDKAVNAVKEFLELNKYSYHTRTSHMRCYRQLGANLTENGKSYSRHSAETWLQDISNELHDGELKIFRRALEKLDDAYNHRAIGCNVGKSAMRQIYRCLQPWCNTLLEEFADEMATAFGPDYTHAAKVSVARFLSRITDDGICELEELSHRYVVDYCREGGGVKGASKQALSADRSHIRRFLRHFTSKGIIRYSSIHMSLDQTVFSRLVFIDTLDVGDRSRFLAAAESSEMNAENYYETALKLDSLFAELKYAETAQHTFHIAYKELFVFLSANSLGYSASIALSWASFMSRYTTQWMTFRRAVMLFEQFREHGRIDPGKVYSYQPNRARLLPSWCRSDYGKYIRWKENAGLAESTLDMCKNSCLRLLEYLCSIGINSWEQVSPETLKDFHKQDFHSTPEGKNAYSIKIRQFLEHLGEIGKIPPTMFLAIPSESARRTSIVNTLQRSDIEGIYRYRESAAGAIELRDVAMILIGLRMGLRASDVIKLRFSDITWDQKCISVQQEKTDSFLKLPMPTEVGNAIFRYITHGRPKAASEFVFINHKTPYDKLSRHVCSAALMRALPGKSRGFHVTRRTFASRMLVSRVESGRIAEALGHVDSSSVMTYLSTDGDKMRLCALPLEDVPLKGGVLS